MEQKTIMAECDYCKRCRRYKKSLGIPDAFFDPTHDRCFCLDCHARRKDELYYSRGDPPKRYSLPLGWCRFAIRTNPGRREAMNVDNTWHRAYHGTVPDAIESILRTGELVRAGCYTMDGKYIGERPGHIADNPHFDSRKIFVSPSIKYAGHQCYATSQRTTLDGKSYTAKVAIQIFIKPGTYEIGKETLAPGDKVSDPMYKDNELEWCTNRQGCTIMYGLLLNLQDIDGATHKADGPSSSSLRQQKQKQQQAGTSLQIGYERNDPCRFQGVGVNFKGKLIGVQKVGDARGDKMCEEAMGRLKAMVKNTGEHTQKIIIHVSLEGIKILDEESGMIIHTHAVRRVSFISRDIIDPRAFGYIYGPGDGSHQFFGIKTEKAAESLVMTLRDLFQVVFEMKKREVEEARKQKEEQEEEQQNAATENAYD